MTPVTAIKIIRSKITIPLCLAVLVAINGGFFLVPVVINIINHLPSLKGDFTSWKDTLSFLNYFEIPHLSIGLFMIFMAVLLPTRNRVAWFFTVILLFTIIILDIFIIHENSNKIAYSSAVLIAMIYYWRQFYYHSLASGTYFAIISISWLIVYSMLGTLYLGDQFTPHVTDLQTAFYFAIVCMSTVGFGDIIPHSTEARMFTLTVIVSGITVFAASISSIAGPMISNNVKRIVKGRVYNMDRKNHYIVVGANPLAVTVYNSLRARGDDVTVVCSPGTPHNYPAKTDIVEGDPSATATLKLAGADKAKSIIALATNDADNAFVILAAKEVAGEDTKTLALVNDTQNIKKMKRVNPDMVFSLPLLGSELLVRTLDGETINNELVTQLFFGHDDKQS